METELELQWYPGHMAKARRELQTRWRLVDVVLEVLDARIPHTSRHPEPVGKAERRPRVLLLAKKDLAEDGPTRQWLDYYRAAGVKATAADLRTGGWVRPVARQLREAAEGGRRRGAGDPVRVLVAGLPNVGKSTAINSLARRAKAETGGKPGVTRSLQWLSAANGLQLLDSPGVLWPGATKGLSALFLAAAGLVPDAVFDNEVAARQLLRYLLRRVPAAVEDRYGPGLDGAGDDPLAEVARRRGMLQAGAAPDTERAAAAVLQDFRTGRLGRMTLERSGTSYSGGEGAGDD